MNRYIQLASVGALLMFIAFILLAVFGSPGNPLILTASPSSILIFAVGASGAALFFWAALKIADGDPGSPAQ